MDLTKEEVEEGRTWGPVKQGKPISGKGIKFGKSYPVMDQGQRKKIIKIANKHSGDMEKAIKQIEKLKKGITDNPAVMDILRKANESKENEMKQESRKYFDTKPGSIQDTVIKMYEDRLNEKKADFLRLTFANNQTVKKVDRWIYKNLSHANPGYMSMIPDEHGKSIEWENMDDADGLMKKLKKAGFRFKVDMREEG